MAPPRKRHVQAELTFRTHGGRRDNAGRPAKGKRSSEPHKKRARHLRRDPVHVTIRVVEELGTLRRRDTRLAIRWATLAIVEREHEFRIVHASIQGNHVHLLVEAENRTALSAGMQAFQISAAKHINRAIGERTGMRRKGKVFADRFHSRALTTPREVRNALVYVFNNWRRHHEDRDPKTRTWKLDPFSTAVDFGGWKELGDAPFLYKPPASFLGLIVWRSRTWLLSEGWKQHGLISVFDVPGPMPSPRRSAART